MKKLIMLFSILLLITGCATTNYYTISKTTERIPITEIEGNAIGYNKYIPKNRYILVENKRTRSGISD
jgi:uncharacterized protein YceK